MERQKSSIALIFPVLFGFFIMGFCDLVGVSVTYAKEQFNWSETQAGFLPSMVFIWFFFLSIPAAVFMNKAGRKNTVLVSIAFTFAGMLIPFIYFNEIICFVAFALLGIGNTILQVSLNPLLTNVVKGDKITSNLTIGQFIKAISSFLGPIIAGFCSNQLGGWEKTFPVFAAVTALSGAWLLLTKIEEKKIDIQSSSYGEVLGLLKDKTILLLFFGILCIVGLDVGMNIVTPKLLIERAGLLKEAAGYGSSWYFASRTIGTAFGAFLLAKFSEKKYFQINTIVILLAVSALLFVDTQYTILTTVCIIAFAMSSIFAIIFSMAIKHRSEKVNEISGLMITGVAGGAIFPSLMGISADITGSQAGSVAVIGLTAIYLVYCAFGIKQIKKEELT